MRDGDHREDGVGRQENKGVDSGIWERAMRIDLEKGRESR